MSLDKEIYVIEVKGVKTEIVLVKDLKEAIKRIFERIRLTNNRDDEVKARLKICDMGGIGKQEVYEILREELGEELI